MTILHKAGCLILGLLLWTAGQAADGGDTPRQYDIELLIFQNLVKNDDGEIWPPDYSSWYRQAATDNTVPAAAPQKVAWLPESSWHLKAERAALDRSSGYHTLAYLAWRQPVADRVSAQALELPASANGNAAWVDGTVRVAVERYLHLYLDLQLHLPSVAAPAAPGADAESGAEPRLPEIRLTEQRRMRSNEIHYFDNPRFGVIALITPYEPPVKPAEPAAATVPGDAAEKPVTAP
jgi:Peptidoglycan-binding protein, CsiV